MKSWKNYIPFYGIYYMWTKTECEFEEFISSLTLDLVYVFLVILSFC